MIAAAFFAEKWGSALMRQPLFSKGEYDFVTDKEHL